MTPERQRIAIAEACGWKYHAFGGGWQSPESNKPDRSLKPPDYHSDLNACHEMEKFILSKSVINRPETPFHRYYGELFRICTISTDTFDKPMEAGHWAICAEAAQRCEAFLRALGKWEESTKPEGGL